MIGRVIEGRYVGASVNKLPDRNVLFIQTEDGTKVALSKSNAISIDDVTDQYPSYGGKVMMVMWNDFETSIFRFGSTEVGHKKESSVIHSTPKTKSSKSDTPKSVFPKGRMIVAIIVALLVLIGIVTSILVISRKHAEAEEAQRTLAMLNAQKLDNVKKSVREQIETIMMNTFIEGGFNHIENSDMQGIIDNMTVRYSDENIDGDYFSFTATYCYIIGDVPQYAEFFVSGFLSDNRFNLKHIRNYTSEYDGDLDSSEDIMSDMSEVQTPELEKSENIYTTEQTSEEYMIDVTPIQWVRNGRDYRYDLLITNKSKEHLKIDGTVVFYDKNNSVIGSYTISVDTLAPRETAFALAVNDTEFDHAEYTLKADVQEYRRSGFDSIVYTVNVINNNKLVLEITNVGSKKIAIWSADALFYNGNDVIASNLAQYTSGLAPNETIYLTIEAYEEFTDYIICFDTLELTD